VAHHVEELLVGPDVVLEGRDVEVADEEAGRRRRALPLPPGAHLGEEPELVAELLVDLGVRDVAAGRHIEIVHREPGRGSGLAERDRDVAGVGAAAERHRAGLREGIAREDRDAVVALLPEPGDEGVAEGLKVLEREAVVRALGLLQAQDVGAALLEKAADLVEAQADGIDVPGRDGELHGAS
jgi:hypothetical protein